ncbi:N-formylglutamate amidohydrolase [Brevundimonas goettingensis]|uniref:N-formylglutamate amidohydrolase n=1 Tax=Brevundimonas goettingensis TaxID=2774190 RepID=A0A975C294_9CAUL|nr:N-formylglutamate amidohydrolase [Brevundimonas goettingensis]QTC90510.1 N-formylglutamate amidohydrolase [Brevundimonas goettingensis]
MTPDALPFSLSLPEGERGPFVFASPHSGAGVPEDMGAAAGLSEASLRSAEDVGVDRLVASGPRRGAPLIAGRFSRSWVDLNRAPEELDPALIEGLEAGEVSAKTAAGFGVIPRKAGDGVALYDRRLMLAEARARLALAHTPYHAALGELMRAAHARHGLAVLVDWHSMPSRAVRGGARGAAGPDVILGDRHGTACASGLTRKLRTLFEAAGWRVGLNQPYAGGYTTQIWGRPDEGYQAIQIELNRALYLDETTLEPGPGYGRCKAVLDGVIAALCAADDGAWRASERGQ